MQKVELFKPDDFLKIASCGDRVANRANEILQEYLESCPVAYFKYLGGKPFNLGPELNENDDTHTARLAFIEELPKGPCKHPILEYKPSPAGIVIKAKCGVCKADLIPEWKEVK